MKKRIPNPHSPEEVRQAFAQTNRDLDNNYLPYVGAEQDLEMGSHSISTTDIAISGGITTVDYIQFDLNHTCDHIEGRLHWNSEDGVLEHGLPGGNNCMQAGQTLLRCRNNSGATILDGKVVCACGAHVGKPTISLADITSHPTTFSFGVTLEDIANNSFGYVIMSGLARNIDTSAVAEGTLAYLSDITPGEITSSLPSHPNGILSVGMVMKSHANEGIIFCDPTFIPYMFTLPDVEHVAPSVDGEFYRYVAANSRFELTSDSSVDHGGLTGLADDDHTEYHNDTRGDARYYQQSEHINVSAGAGDAGKPVILDAGGHVDATMINDADIDHGSIGGLVDDDHVQYHTDARGDARYYTQSLLDAGQLDNRYFTEAEHVNSSAGAGDAGKPVVLDSGGHVAVSMLDGDYIPRILDSSLTFYVRTTGSDSNGGTGSSDAFLTVQRAITELYKYVPAESLVYINIGEGEFAEAGFILKYHSGSAVQVTGVYSDDTGCSISNITGITVDGTLSYFDIDVTLSVGKTSAVGQYILVKTMAATGTKPELCLGCHKVTAWNSGTRAATIRIYGDNGNAHVPSGTLAAATLTVVKTVISFASSNGISISGSYHGGVWNGLVLEGSSNKRGVYLSNGGVISLGTSFGTSQWYQSLSANYGAICYAPSTIHSKAYYTLAATSTGGVINVPSGILTGCASHGLYCNAGGTLLASSCHVIMAGSSYSVYCARAGFSDIANANVLYGNSTVAAYAYKGGIIEASGCTFTGYTTDTSSDAYSTVIV